MWYLMDISKSGLDNYKYEDIMYFKIQVVEKSRYLL